MFVMKLHYHTLDIPYEFTFTISRHSHTHTTTVIVELTYEENGRSYTGLGEAVPSEFYNENAQSVCAFYDRLIQTGTLSDLTPFDIQKLLTRFAQMEGN